jgi:hypothetical protein
MAERLRAGVTSGAMKKGIAAFVVLLAACSNASKAPPRVLGQIAFHVLSERQNPAYCVDAPNFQVATTESQWTDVFDQKTQCQPQHDVQLPDVDFKRELGLAAWWRVENCLGFTVHTDTIERVGAQVVVSATATSPGPGACATARGELESFFVLEKSTLFTGSEPVKFVLNGVVVGTERPAPAAS